MESTSIAPLSTGQEQFRGRLTAFLTEYAPDQLPDVDRIIEVWADREEYFFRALVRKYGPEPAQDEQPRSETGPQTNYQRYHQQVSVDPTLPAYLRRISAWERRRQLRRHTAEGARTIGEKVECTFSPCLDTVRWEAQQGGQQQQQHQQTYSPATSVAGPHGITAYRV